MKNDYDIRGDTTAIFLNSPKYGAMETLIATSDIPRAQEFPGMWFPLWCRGTRTYYVRGKMREQDGHWLSVSFHRWILNVTDPIVHVDHVCHDTLDNCRWALNKVTAAENGQNQRVNKRNKTGISGVGWNTQHEKWKAHIRVNRRLIHLGYFDDFDSARLARQSAEREHFTYRQKIN